MRVLLDTSVVIAAVDGEIDSASLPGEGAISAITLCELYHGILIASDRQRAVRLRALDVANRSFETLPVDHRVAPYFGQLMADARGSRRLRPEAPDTLIAATAMAYGLPVAARDRDFKRFDGVEVVLV